MTENTVRMVTHKGIEKEHVEKAISTIEIISNELQNEKVHAD